MYRICFLIFNERYLAYYPLNYSVRLKLPKKFICSTTIYKRPKNMKKIVKTLIRDFCKFGTFTQDFFLETVETRDRDRDQAFETKTKILKS